MPHRLQRRPRRRGKILVMFVILLPAILGVLGLVFDGGLLMGDARHTQQAADAAATAAAMDLLLGKSAVQAEATAIQYVQIENGMDDAEVTVEIPPISGAYAGRTGFVEVTVKRRYQSRLIQVVGSPFTHEYSVRAVAGLEPSSAPAAIVVLDPDPAPITVPSIPLTLPAVHSSLAGLEVEGVGQLSVDGAVLVNTTWGGVDEDGNAAGETDPPPYGAMCTPLLPLTQLRARDIRVAGGVDNPANYGNFDEDEQSPLDANRLPVPDPLANLPAPTVNTDANNVVDTEYGGLRIATMPLISPTETLQPGVYDWIEIVSGTVVFQPGVYVIRDVNPVTGVALNISGGSVTAEGVMFYITNSTDYSVTTGLPDSTDGETEPPALELASTTPSVVITSSLVDGAFSPLVDATSPFDGMLIYQRRKDRRPIVIAHQSLLAGGGFGGRVYAKWGHVTLVVSGEYDASFAVGTMRVVTVLDSTIAPSEPLPAATDVFLVE